MSSVVADGLSWRVRERGSEAASPLLLVHGFTGRGASWGAHTTAFAHSFRVIVVDLPGHGRTAAPADPSRASIERTADDLAAILDRLGASPAHVIGYSLGARVALRLAVAHPGSVRRLVLESPSAGIEDAAARADRRRADDQLADDIERDGIEAFVARWERQPIFASQAALPLRIAARQRAIRLANRPAGLAASLRGAGQGAMEPLHARLAAVASPTLVITGALDGIGRPRAEQIANALPNARLAVVDRAGHTPHLERPAAFRRLALEFLQEDPAA